MLFVYRIKMTVKIVYKYENSYDTACKHTFYIAPRKSTNDR